MTDFGLDLDRCRAIANETPGLILYPVSDKDELIGQEFVRNYGDPQRATVIARGINTGNSYQVVFIKRDDDVFQVWDNASFFLNWTEVL